MLKKLQNDSPLLNKLDKEYAGYHDYFLTDDDLVIAFEKKTPRIRRELWYADEDYETGEYRTASEIATTKEQLKQCFISENMRELHLLTDWLERHPVFDIYISKTPQYSGQEYGARYIQVLSPDDWEIQHMERKLTEQELAELKAYEEEKKAEFIKRLERYWKRYSDKVHINTYWANR